MADSLVVQGRRLLRMPAVVEKTGLSARTIYDYMSKGRFPKQVRVSGAPGSLGGIVAWDAQEVEAWVRHKLYEGREYLAPPNNNHTPGT